MGCAGAPARRRAPRTVSRRPPRAREAAPSAPARRAGRARCRRTARRPARAAMSPIAARASSPNSATEPACSSSQTPTRWCGTRRQLSRARLVGQDRQSPVHLHRVAGRSRRRRRGPARVPPGSCPTRSGRTRPGAHGTMASSRRAAGQRLGAGALDEDVHQRAGLGGAGEVDRLVGSACVLAIRRGRFGFGPRPGPPGRSRPAQALWRAACSCTRSTSRTILVRLTSSGTWFSIAAASVPRRGE